MFSVPAGLCCTKESDPCSRKWALEDYYDNKQKSTRGPSGQVWGNHLWFSSTKGKALCVGAQHTGSDTAAFHYPLNTSRFITMTNTDRWLITGALPWLPVKKKEKKLQVQNFSTALPSVLCHFRSFICGWMRFHGQCSLRAGDRAWPTVPDICPWNLGLS